MWVTFPCGADSRCHAIVCFLSQRATRYIRSRAGQQGLPLLRAHMRLQISVWRKDAMFQETLLSQCSQNTKYFEILDVTWYECAEEILAQNFNTKLWPTFPTLVVNLQCLSNWRKRPKKIIGQYKLIHHFNRFGVPFNTDDKNLHFLFPTSETFQILTWCKPTFLHVHMKTKVHIQSSAAHSHDN